MFGAVPIVTDPTIAEDVYSEWKPSRPTKEEYVSFMLGELGEVYNDLDETPTNENWGRMTKGAALALMMRIQLNDKNWAGAAKSAQNIMNLHVYDLEPDYKKMFSVEKEGPSNVEAIFVIPLTTANLDYSWTWHACVLPNQPMYKTETGVTMEIWGGLRMPWAFYDKYEAGDKRLETIVRYYTDTEGNQVDYRTVEHSKAIGACPKKYMEDPDYMKDSSGNDFIMFRYADVLLTRAEALNELEGPTDEVVGLINEVRERAGLGGISAADYTRDSLRDFILDERGRELYCEGYRRDDLIRHGKFVEYAHKEGWDYVQDYYVLFPIPQKAIDENPNLKQNPGYEG